MPLTTARNKGFLSHMLYLGETRKLVPSDSLGKLRNKFDNQPYPPKEKEEELEDGRIVFWTIYEILEPEGDPDDDIIDHTVTHVGLVQVSERLKVAWAGIWGLGGVGNGLA